MSGCFLRIGSLYFSEFWHGGKNPYEVVHDISITWKNFFCPIKFGKCVKIRSKIVLFLNLKKNLVINFQWICSVMKIFIICCVQAQIIGYGQSGLWTLKLTVSQECINGVNWFFACWYNFMQIKSWLKILGLPWSKMSLAKLIVSQKLKRWNGLIFGMLVHIQES